MTERTPVEAPSASPTDRIAPAKYITLILADFDMVKDHLDSGDFITCNLLDVKGASALPPPFNLATIDISANDEAIPNIEASARFKTKVLRSEVNEWPRHLLGAISNTLAELGYKSELHNYDPMSLFVPLDRKHVARLSIAPTRRDCYIDISIEDTISRQNFTASRSLTASQAAFDVTRILSVAIDHVHERYGRSPDDTAFYTVQGDASIDVDSEPSPELERRLGSSAVLLHRHHPEIIIDDDPRPSFHDIGGAYEPKRRLQELINLHKNPEIAQLYDLEPKHFILHGPPGTGKTTLIEAFAHSIDANLREVPSSQIIDKYIGDSAKNIRAVFDEAYETPDDRRTVLFFDEIDAWATANTSNEIQAQRTFQQQFNGSLAEHPNVVVAAATNRDIADLPEALVRSGRLEPIVVPKPTEQERADIWITLLSSSRARSTTKQDNSFISPFLDPFNYDVMSLSYQTGGFTGADIRACIDAARKKCFHDHLATGAFQSVSMERLMQAITTFRQSR